MSKHLITMYELRKEEKGTLRKITKTSLILRHLKEHGKISSMDAFERYKATRLSAVIFNLRKDYIIDTEMVPFDGGRYGLYHFRGEIE